MALEGAKMHPKPGVGPQGPNQRPLECGRRPPVSVRKRIWKRKVSTLNVVTTVSTNLRQTVKLTLSIFAVISIEEFKKWKNYGFFLLVKVVCTNCPLISDKQLTLIVLKLKAKQIIQAKIFSHWIDTKWNYEISK